MYMEISLRKVTIEIVIHELKNIIPNCFECKEKFVRKKTNVEKRILLTAIKTNLRKLLCKYIKM